MCRVFSWTTKANFLALPEVSDCAVVPVARNGAVQSLAAFVVPSGDCPTDPTEAATAADGLRTLIGQRLPAYMLPRKIHLRPFLPLTANGKADRRQLAEWATGISNVVKS